MKISHTRASITPSISQDARPVFDYLTKNKGVEQGHDTERTTTNTGLDSYAEKICVRPYQTRFTNAP